MGVFHRINGGESQACCISKCSSLLVVALKDRQFMLQKKRIPSTSVSFQKEYKLILTRNACSNGRFMLISQVPLKNTIYTNIQPAYSWNLNNKKKKLQIQDKTIKSSPSDCDLREHNLRIGRGQYQSIVLRIIVFRHGL